MNLKQSANLQNQEPVTPTPDFDHWVLVPKIRVIGPMC